MKMLVIKIGVVSRQLIDQVRQKFAFGGEECLVEKLANSTTNLEEAALDYVAKNSQVWFIASQDEFLNLSLVETLKLPVLFLINEKVSLAIENRILYWQKQTLVLGAIFEQKGLDSNLSSILPWVAVGLKTIFGKMPAETIEAMTPPRFKRQLFNLAKRELKTIILPEGEEPRVQAAAIEAAKKGIAKCILLGNPNSILKKTGEVVNLVALDPNTLCDRYVNPLYELRKAKGMTLDEASKQLRSNRNLLATMMLHDQRVDGLVSGVAHTTAETILPALQVIKTKADTKLVSSIFLVCLPTKVVVFGDCAVNMNPTPEDLKEITLQSAKTAKAFGIDPKVALLSYSTLGSAKGPDVEMVIEAARLIKESSPELAIEGPLQFDAAFSLEVGQIKAPDSQVAGKANIFIFPSLEAGNIGYKIAQRCGNSLTIGPILQGLRKPVSDLSRGCTVDDIVYTIAITAIQAQN